MRYGPLFLLPLLLACTSGPQSPTGSPAGPDELAERASEIGGLVRAAQSCGLTLSQPTLERAARIEEAALELHRNRGGTAARNAFLQGMAPPRFDGRQRGRDRAAWCTEKRPAVQQMDAFLNSPDGTTFVQRAEAMRTGLQP